MNRFLSSKKISRRISSAIDIHSIPAAARVDNAQEFTCRDFERWANDEKIIVHHSQPEDPCRTLHWTFSPLYRDAVPECYLLLALPGRASNSQAILITIL
jgi:hypothetical protein